MAELLSVLKALFLVNLRHNHAVKDELSRRIHGLVGCKMLERKFSSKSPFGLLLSPLLDIQHGEENGPRTSPYGLSLYSMAFHDVLAN